MVRSSTESDKSSKSGYKPDKLISERQKKTSIKGTVGEYETIAKLTKEGLITEDEKNKINEDIKEGGYK